MINITVKTLDSQNHKFTVEDDLTVEQFKNHIAEQVNVPAGRQRIIYCGRVLQDSSKLTDYDVDGKVVHLVQRAPPNSNPRAVRSLTPPPDLGRISDGFRGFERVGNTVYMGMGSMSFPQGLMDPQQIIPPRATHTLSSSRLNVARRMLRNAENVIRQLENPATGSEPPPQQDETPEEEMTPVIEARVIVPPNGDHSLDGNAILNAVQNTIFPAVSVDPATAASTSSGAGSEGSGEQQFTPASSTPISSSTENLNAEANAEAPADRSRQSRTRCRGTEMAALLATLNELQLRFAPFLARYQAFMQDDPQVAQENIEETRQMLNRVSRVLHYFGHAYHSLSDIIINVSQPPPRLLLCRPILIQPPTVVQAGIPLQVEAQINLSTDRSGSAPNQAPSQTAESTTPPTSTETTANLSSSNATSTSNPPTNEAVFVPHPPPHPGGPNIALPPGFVTGLPFMHAGPMRVIATPVDIRTLRSAQLMPRPTNNNNNTAASASRAAPAADSTPPAAESMPPVAESAAPQTAPSLNANAPPQPNQPQGQANGQFGPNGGNLEFFMEVTAEGLRGGNFLQSIMQLVDSQLGNTLNQAQNQRPDSTAPNQAGGAQGPSQPSQARSTQTNPTTSTHTRSTPRPHVHMTQQAVPGGFDPFLHCYSHHVTEARSQRIVPPQESQQPSSSSQSGSAANAPSAPPNPTPSGNSSGNAMPNLPNLAARIEDIVRPFRLFDSHNSASMMADAMTQAVRQQVSPASSAPNSRNASNGQNANNQNTSQSDPHHNLFGFFNDLISQALPDLVGGRANVSNMFSHNQESYVQGTNLITDFVMLLLRNLRLEELLMVASGNMSALERHLDTILDFFRTEICQNDTSDAGVSRATNRMMNEFRPLLNALESMPPRDNIDIARTMDRFFRHWIPHIIQIAVSTEPRADGTSTLSAASLITPIWRAIEELLVLALHCCATGQRGVETVFSQFMVSALVDTNNSDSIYQFGIASGLSVLRQMINVLAVTPADIQQYVVQNVSQQPPASAATENMQQESAAETNRQHAVEPMDVDYVTNTPARTDLLAAAPRRVEETEPLPNVVWGSEPWHRQTPEEWVPIITTDIQRQRRQSIQPPFSDAYLSGMPSKRRRLISKSKPQGSLTQAISENIRQAVTSGGLASAAPLDVVAQAASESPEIQTAYRSLLQSRVQSNLRNNEDFNREQYPHTERYFNQPSAE